MKNKWVIIGIVVIALFAIWYFAFAQTPADNTEMADETEMMEEEIMMEEEMNGDEAMMDDETMEYQAQ